MTFFDWFKEFAGPVAYTLIGFEFLLCTLQKKKVVYWKDTASNLFMGFVGNFSREFIFLAFPLPFIRWITLAVEWKWEYTAGAWLACFIIYDFLEYWSHRWAHENRFLWIFHNVHHSSREFNFSTGSRQSWVVEIYRFLFLVPLAFIGFPLWMILICRALHRYLQLFQHTTIIGKLGWLEYVLATPSIHRVHHGRNPQYINKNYGNIFCVWDRLFKTYEPEVEEVDYGPQSDIPQSYNPFVIQFYEPLRMFQELMREKSFKGRLRFLMKTPGMDPELVVKEKKIG